MLMLLLRYVSPLTEINNVGGPSAGNQKEYCVMLLEYIYKCSQSDTTTPTKVQKESYLVVKSIC